MLIDLRGNGLTGKELEALLDRAHITANKNSVPFETASPFITSGLRVGTPAMTSRGMGEKEAALIADLITEIIQKREDAVEKVAKTVRELTVKFPLYQNDIL